MATEDPAAAAAGPPVWSISVRTVGGGAPPSPSPAQAPAQAPAAPDGDAGAPNADEGGTPSPARVSPSSEAAAFTLAVDPESTIEGLRERITSVTGLAAGRQRLIYRGKIIGGGGGGGGGGGEGGTA